MFWKEKGPRGMSQFFSVIDYSHLRRPEEILLWHREKSDFTELQLQGALTDIPFQLYMQEIT